MPGLAATPSLPITFWVVACVACLTVAASRSIGWLRFVLPLGWLAFAGWAIWADVSLSGYEHSDVLLVLGGLLPLAGWFRRPAWKSLKYPFPLRETVVALLYPDAHRIISTAAVFDSRYSDQEDEDGK